MDKEVEFIEPYKPSSIHKIYDWIDRIPGPYWMFSVAFLVVTGLLNNIVAWIAHVLPFGEINWYYATTGLFFSYFFAATDFLIRVAKSAVSEFLTVLDTDENKKHRILFEFTHLPARLTGVLFIVGATLGFFQGIYLLPAAPEMNRAFPALEVAMYALPTGMFFIMIYVVFRSPRLISRLFQEQANIDIFNKTSLFAVSRYSAWTIIVIAIPSYLQFVLLPSFVEIKANFSFLFIGWLLVLIVFWMPLRGVNRKLVSEKGRLMRDVNLRIRANFDLLHTKMDNDEYKNIADIREMITTLQMERQSLKSISTWPWQSGTLPSLLTAVVLPMLGSLLIDIINKFVK